MLRVRCLAEYPYIVVRIACAMCPARQGAYRLARLAEKFGADTAIEDVLARIAFDCPYPPPHKARGNQYHPRCHVRLPDLEGNPPPPNLPPALMALRVVKGGKG